MSIVQTARIQTARDLFPASADEARDLARDLYTAGNNAGQGEAPDAESVEDAIEEIGEVVIAAETTDDVSVCLDGDRLIAIGGDGFGRQAWAVDITDRVIELAQHTYERDQLQIDRDAPDPRDALEEVA